MKPCDDCQKLHGAPAHVDPAPGSLLMLGNEVQTVAQYTCSFCNSNLVREMGDTWRVMDLEE